MGRAFRRIYSGHVFSGSQPGYSHWQVCSNCERVMMRTRSPRTNEPKGSSTARRFRVNDGRSVQSLMSLPRAPRRPTRWLQRAGSKAEPARHTRLE
jgi:hypothetical protein